MTLPERISASLAAAGLEPAGPLIFSEAPEHTGADYASPSVISAAQAAGRTPREAAEMAADNLRSTGDFAAVEVAGPGFINFTLTDAARTEALAAGGFNAVTRADEPQRVNVEYISANPTGPLHIGNSRGGPLGEAVCRILEAQGHTVTREYYLNDIGGQADAFAASVRHHIRLLAGLESEPPAGGYPGAYVAELAAELDDQLAEAEPGRTRGPAVAAMAVKIRATAQRMGVSFDEWFAQSSLRESGATEAVVKRLVGSGAAIEKDGALWLRGGLGEDDRETVLMKSDGAPTYFADDLAYYAGKSGARGYGRTVCVLGANHSGHVPRMRAGLAALDVRVPYEYAVYQYVQLKEGGTTKRMAKREGTFITAGEVLDLIPRDVFTWFMLAKSNETHLDFDLELATDTSDTNPVYAVQYAHARACSVMAKAPAELPALTAYAWRAEERAVLRHLHAYASTVGAAAAGFRPNLLATYLHELALRYHRFYSAHRIISEDVPATAVRLRLTAGVRAVLASGLSLLNVSAPETMGERAEPLTS